MAKKTAKKAAKKGAKKARKPAAAKAGPKARARVEDLAPAHIEMFEAPWIMKRDELDVFTLYRFFTGLIDVDLVLRPSAGKRVGIIGEKSVGKTIMTHILEGAAQRTCRHCWLPIIPWVNEETGEIKATCKCGKNDPMVVIHVDAEDSFDPLWARRWGIDVDLEEIDRGDFKLYKAKHETFWAVLPMEGNGAFNFIDDTIRNGAVDMTVIDSIAVLTPKETLENAKGEQIGIGRERVSPRARLLQAGISRVLNAQIIAKLNFNSRATLVWTNQYYMGPTRNPRQDPRRAAGGLKPAYQADHDMKILSAKYERGPGEGVDKAIKFIDVTFEANKSKSGGTAGGIGKYRLFLDRMTTRHGVMSAGDTDEPDRLAAYLQQIGLFEQRKTEYVVLGRAFKKVSDIRQFLKRPDIQYLARYPILKVKAPQTALDHLKREHYDYSPWGQDVIFDLTEKLPDVSATRGRASGDAKKNQKSAEEDDWLFSDPEEAGQDGKPE